PTHDGRIAAEKTTTVPAPPIVDHRHLASPGTLFLLQRQSVTTGSGVTGFPPGTKVHLLKDSGDTMIVSADTAQLTVPSDAVTNDVDLGALAARRDAQSQAELARVLAREAAEARADEAKQNQELAKHVEQMEQNRGVVGVGHSTKLDREAYHEKVNVTHRPHIYYWPYRP
ncbi:MAG: hypothetical protein ACJ8I9_05585, partial [Chthoniobacterales bacterium]